MRKHRAWIRHPLYYVTALICAAPLACGTAWTQSIERLREMPIEQLSEIDVTSVSKTREPLSDAPAAVYIISHDDIMRSAATTIPEMLRLAPNLEVAQVNASTYAISARGFNVNNRTSLSNKLLVLIDGRTVYSPMFGGVYWDMLAVPPEAIERIEVISGPGATLWGANAVNGVINIITRDTNSTQGGVLTLGAGNLERQAGIQYSGHIGPDLTWRLHGEFSAFEAFQKPDGEPAGDRWSRPDGGFRIDWHRPRDSVSAQGDVVTALEGPKGFVREGSLSTSWEHRFDDGSNLQLLAWTDALDRVASNGSPAYSLTTDDIEVQHNFTLAGWNSIVWGAGERTFRYKVETRPLTLFPNSQSLSLGDIFAQDTISLTRTLKLTLGVKVEHEPFAGLLVLPGGRIAWKPTEDWLLWTAVSRSVRSPTPADVNLRQFAGPTLILSGSSGFRPETLMAYEIGTRVQISSRASLSISAFYDVYDHLRSLDPGPQPSGLPVTFGNLMSGDVIGVEVWGDVRLTNWWQLSAGFDLQHENIRFLPGSIANQGLALVANDPAHQASLHSAMDLGHDVTWDVYAREVGPLPHPQVPGYVELTTRIAWDITPSVQVSLSGLNLLHARHYEFIDVGVATEVPRSFFAQVRLRF
jgi:iron complex outermembrane recepter protein